MITSGKTMPENIVPLPANTITFGEKQTSAGDYYMDTLEPAGSGDGYVIGNDFSGIAEQSRHDSAGGGTHLGGSNYTFMDGSARFLKFPTSVDPLNLWCINPSNQVANVISH
jgi:prepilin-type processing-associated H-X9-DG protein